MGAIIHIGDKKNQQKNQHKNQLFNITMNEFKQVKECANMPKHKKVTDNLARMRPESQVLGSDWKTILPKTNRECGKK